LIEGLVYDLHPIAGTGTTRMINNVADDMTVHADAALLRRVFQNLLANALAYTPNGEVVLSARRTAANDGVECEVSDNGTGIPEHRLKHIFEKFETDNKTLEAIGLGLTICKTFIEAHGGTIVVKSEWGAGSTFRFTLPD
jgi:two-component system phosphate regulon sensor histidine kinase PhoR